MAEAKVGVLVTAKDEASAKLKAVQKSLGDLDKTAKASAEGVKSLTGGVGGMVAMLGGIGIGVAGIAALGTALGDLTKQGLRANALEASFESLAEGVGASSQQMLVGMRAVSQGMISDGDLILSANRAMMLGVADTTEEMSALMKVAATRGQAMGLSMTQAFQDIVTGLGRESPLILDNLGIVLDLDRTYKKYAESIDKTVSALTAAERKQALVNSVMASTDTSVAVAVNGFAKLEASWANLSDALGKSLASSGINEAISGLAEGINAQVDAASEAQFKTIQDAAGNTRDEISRLKQEISTYNEMLAQNRASAFVADESQITDQIYANEMAIVLLTAKLPMLEAAANKAAIAMGKIQGPQLRALGAIDLSWGQSAIAAGEAYGREFAEARAAAITAANKQFQSTAIDVIPVVGEEMALEWIREANAGVAGMMDTWQAQGATIDEIFGVKLPYYIQQTKQTLTDAIDLSGLADQMQLTGAALAESLAAPFKGNIQRAVSDLSASLNALNSVNVNGPAEAIKQGELAQQKLNNYAAEYARLVDDGTISQEYANLAMEKQVALILGQVAAYSSARAAALGLGETVGWIKGQLSDATSQAWQLAGALRQQLANANAVAARVAVAAEGASRAAGIGRGIFLDKLLPGIPDVITKGESVGKSLVAGVTRAISSGGGGSDPIQEAFDNILGKVKGAISGALSADIGGLNVKDFLPREDAVNENARRLAAIMRDGLAGQDWLPQFKSETGGLFDELIASGDVRGAAARILQEFQAGMRPELIDREMVKENVRRMLLGEQSMAELADSIATELAGEMGMSIARAQALVGAQLGTTPTAMMDTAVGQGMEGGAQAETFVSGWVATMNKLYTRFFDTGAGAGEQWGAGFMTTVESGVPATLISLLVSLVTPGVMATFATQTSAAGAQP